MIGSASGVALMGLEKVEFLWYARVCVCVLGGGEGGKRERESESPPPPHTRPLSPGISKMCL